MAGIGFVIQKLTKKDDLLGVFRAYTHAAMASTGPWLFTVLALIGITQFFTSSDPTDLNADFGYDNFRIVVIYNFAFSLVLSAPVFMIVTRYIADEIHKKDVTNTPSVMLGSLILLYLIQLPVVGWFYMFYVDFPLSMRIAAIVNVFMITSVWALAVFLTALKDYFAVSVAFAVGMITAALSAQFLKDSYGEAGMLNGFSFGLAIIVFTLVAKIFSEYSYRLDRPFAMLPHFRKYWELAVGGIFYNAAIWIDKWIMWFAPEAIKLPSKMVMYPDYDSATFLAYLTIVPALATFMVSVETHFFERYQRYYDDILGHMPLRRIRENQQRIIDSVLASARNFILVQGVIAFLAILLAVEIINLCDMVYTQIGMFRFAVLGAFFHVLLLFELIALSYFDSRKLVMRIQIVYFFANTLLTLWSLNQGFPYYGMGYFMASMLTFGLATFLLFTHTRKLTYHSFISNNNAIIT